jgi:cyclophilin family peptidyl-prolyl cis-trans isomerase
VQFSAFGSYLTRCDQKKTCITARRTPHAPKPNCHERLAMAIEFLESRTLLSVSVAQPVAPVTLSTVNNSTTIDLSSNFTDPQTSGTFVQFQTTLGNVEVQLFNQQTPLTVANFLQYVNQHLYDGTIFSRSVPSFVVQGGGFTSTGAAITAFAPVQNEPVFSNTLGTIAMAKLPGDPNSATNQFFFNTADNSQNLDNQNGGFTVFGDVVQGLNIVEAINQLPTTSATLSGNAFTDLPVLSANGGTAPSNLVVVNSVQTVAAPQVQITAVSDNTRIVTTSVNGESLTLNAVPGNTGFAHVTITATGPNGTSVSEIVRVQVTGAQTLNVPLGGGNSRAVTFRDSNGNAATVRFAGAGTAVAAFSGTGLSLHGGVVQGQDVQLDSLTASGTTSSSSVQIDGPSSIKNEVPIGDITITGGAAQIDLHHALLVGDLSASGAVRKLVVDAAEEGSISVGSGSGTTVQGTSFANESLTSGAVIDSLDVKDWINNDPNQVVTAPSIKSVHSKGSITAGLHLSATSHALGSINVKGFIGGNWTLGSDQPTLHIGGIADTFSGTFTKAIPSLVLKLGMGGSLTIPSIGNLRIDAGVANAVLRLTGALKSSADDIKTLTVKGAISNTAILSTGNIGSISAKGIAASDIFAGVGSLETGQVLPIASSDFSGHAKIASVKSAAAKKTVGYTGSNIAAFTVGNLSLGSTTSKNSGVSFGIAGNTIANLSLTDTSVKQNLSFNHVTSATKLAAQITARKLKLNDFKINVIT